MKNPGSFKIPFSIDGVDLGRILCDLEASINLMLLSVHKKLETGTVRPTTISLQLADRFIMTLEGKIEDVLVKMEKFIFLIDFIILDYEPDCEVPIILGQPFLSTDCILIDVHQGELTMKVNDQEVKFNVFDAL